MMAVQLSPEVRERRRQQWAESKRRKRAEERERKERQAQWIREQVEAIPGNAKRYLCLAAPEEMVEAGQLAGMIETCFRNGLSIVDREGILEWLDDHPIGCSIVLACLASAGWGPDFLRWRGDF